MIQTIKENGERYFVHYGDVAFEKCQFDPIMNAPGWEKPSGGLWASDVNADWGWRDWCKSEDWWPSRSGADTFDKYCENYFHFTLKEGTRIFRLEDIIDFYALPIDHRAMKRWGRSSNYYKKYYRSEKFKFIDWLKIKDLGVDVIEYIHGHAWYFETWDVDSIVVLNPDVVLPM